MTGAPTNAGAPLLTHPRLRVKLAALSIEAFALINKVWLFCQDAGNGGRFHIDELPAACDRLLTPAKLKRALAELERPEIEHRDGTSSPLWLSVVDEHVQMPAWWIEINPGAEVWQDDALRWRRARNKQLNSPKFEDFRAKVRKRDRNLCRYCGERVKWGANNSDLGATHDHVDPDEDNTLSNVVVSCRLHNGRKKDRTPEQWIADDPAEGLSLLPAGTTAEQAAALRKARDGPPRVIDKVEPESNSDSTQVRSALAPARESASDRTRVEPESNPIGFGPTPASSRLSASTAVNDLDSIPHPALREDQF